MKSATSEAQTTALEFFGAAVQGPLHRNRSVACEDAWRGKSFQTSAAIAIGDGVGSKSFSSRGAKAACDSAINAARLWIKEPSVEPSWICRWLEAQWRFAVAPHEPNQCAATCHLFAVHDAQELIYAGLGDGMALFQVGDHPVQCLSARRPEDFVNESLALGSNHRLTDWVLARIPLPPAPWIAILATDGVADDLRPEKLDSFVMWLRDDLSASPKAQRALTLRRALRDWPTPGHLDDKTLAVLMHR